MMKQLFKCNHSPAHILCNRPFTFLLLQDQSPACTGHAKHHFTTVRNGDVGEVIFCPSDAPVCRARAPSVRSGVTLPPRA